MRVLRWLRDEPVLAVSAALAVLSMLLRPPGPAYLHYVDARTLACLFCLMCSVKALERLGALHALSAGLIRRVRDERRLGLLLVFLCGGLSMFVTNDVALLALVPLTLITLRPHGNAAFSGRVVILQTVAANIGSALTPIGNPQNLYLYAHYGMNAGRFLQVMAPYVGAGGALLLAFCLLVPARPIAPGGGAAQEPLPRWRLAAYGALFLVSALCVFRIVPVAAALAAVVAGLMLLDRRALLSVDYSLLLTFVCLFVFVGNLSGLPGVQRFLQDALKQNLALSAAAASQLISNVPAAIFLSRFTPYGEALLVGVNIGGLGTLIASMASVISYKLYAAEHKAMAGRYLARFTLYNAVFLAALAALYLALNGGYGA